MNEPGHLYELVHWPDVTDPVLVVALEGWIDAGIGASAAMAHLLQEMDTTLVATFVLLAWRGIRSAASTPGLVEVGLLLLTLISQLFTWYQERPGRWIAQRFFEAEMLPGGETANMGVYLMGGKACGIYTRVQVGPTDANALSVATLVRADAGEDAEGGRAQ